VLVCAGSRLPPVHGHHPPRYGAGSAHPASLFPRTSLLRGASTHVFSPHVSLVPTAHTPTKCLPPVRPAPQCPVARTHCPPAGAEAQRLCICDHHRQHHGPARKGSIVSSPATRHCVHLTRASAVKRLPRLAIYQQFRDHSLVASSRWEERRREFDTMSVRALLTTPELELLVGPLGSHLRPELGQRFSPLASCFRENDE